MAEWRMRDRIETVEATIAAALAEVDLATAASLLPAALVTVQVEYGAAIAESLMATCVPIDQAHAALVARAVKLFGVEQRIVPPPAHEPLTRMPTTRHGGLFPR